MKWLVVLLIVLAGCAGPTDPVEVEQEEEVLDQEPRPEWELGHAWSAEDNFGGASTFVVTGATSQGWTLDTDSEELAWFHAREPVSYLGALDQDLAGSQGTDRVAYFDWPLEEGKQWTTMWDGQSVQITVTRDGDLWAFEAVSDQGPEVVYTYDPAKKWFGRLAFLGPEGEETYTLTVGDLQEEWQGQVVRFGTEEPLNITLEGPGSQGSDWSPPESTDLWIDARSHCTTGAVSAAVGPVDPPASLEQGWHLAGACPMEFTGQGVIAEAPYQGVWGYAAGSSSPDLELQIEVFPRTKTVLEVG